MNRYRSYAATVLLSCTPLAASANQGLNALGSLLVLWGASAALIIVSLIIGAINISAKRTWLRVISIIILVITMACTYISIYFAREFVIIYLVIIMIQGMLIAGSIRKENPPANTE